MGIAYVFHHRGRGERAFPFRKAWKPWPWWKKEKKDCFSSRYLNRKKKMNYGHGSSLKSSPTTNLLSFPRVRDVPPSLSLSLNHSKSLIFNQILKTLNPCFETSARNKKLPFWSVVCKAKVTLNSEARVRYHVTRNLAVRIRILNGCNSRLLMIRAQMNGAVQASRFHFRKRQRGPFIFKIKFEWLCHVEWRWSSLLQSSKSHI